MPDKDKLKEIYDKLSTPEEKIDDLREHIEGLHNKIDANKPISKEEMKSLVKSLIPNVKNGIDGKNPTSEELSTLIKPLIPKIPSSTIDSGEDILKKIRSIKKPEGLSIFDLKEGDWLEKKLLWFQGNIVGGILKVAHDNTLTGDGTSANPLSVVGAGGGNTLADISLASTTIAKSTYTLTAGVPVTFIGTDGTISMKINMGINATILGGGDGTELYYNDSASGVESSLIAGDLSGVLADAGSANSAFMGSFLDANNRAEQFAYQSANVLNGFTYAANTINRGLAVPTIGAIAMNGLIATLRMHNLTSGITRQFLVTSGGIGYSGTDQFILPDVDGTPGQAIVTDGSGNLSFASSSSTLADVSAASTTAPESIYTFTLGVPVSFNNGAERYFLLDHTNGLYGMGDIDKVDNGNSILINDATSDITASTDGIFYIKDVSGNAALVIKTDSNWQVFAGDVSGVANKTLFLLNDLSSTITTSTGVWGSSGAFNIQDVNNNVIAEFSVKTGIVAFGDLSGAGNHIQFQINDTANAIYAILDGSFNIQDITGHIAFTAKTFDSGFVAVSMGDVAGAGNKTMFSADDNNSTATVRTQEFFNVQDANGYLAFQVQTQPTGVIKVLIGDITSVPGGHNTKIILDDGSQLITITNVPTYANDAAAIVGGLTTGQLYKTTLLGTTSLNIVP